MCRQFEVEESFKKKKKTHIEGRMSEQLAFMLKKRQTKIISAHSTHIRAVFRRVFGGHAAAGLRIATSQLKSNSCHTRVFWDATRAASGIGSVSSPDTREPLIPGLSMGLITFEFASSVESTSESSELSSFGKALSIVDSDRAMDRFLLIRDSPTFAKASQLVHALEIDVNVTVCRPLPDVGEAATWAYVCSPSLSYDSLIMSPSSMVMGTEDLAPTSMRASTAWTSTLDSDATRERSEGAAASPEPISLVVEQALPAGNGHDLLAAAKSALHAISESLEAKLEHEVRRVESEANVFLIQAEEDVFCGRFVDEALWTSLRDYAARRPLDVHVTLCSSVSPPAPHPAAVTISTAPRARATEHATSEVKASGQEEEDKQSRRMLQLLYRDRYGNTRIAAETAAPRQGARLDNRLLYDAEYKNSILAALAECRTCTGGTYDYYLFRRSKGTTESEAAACDSGSEKSYQSLSMSGQAARDSVPGLLFALNQLCHDDHRRPQIEGREVVAAASTPTTIQFISPTLAASDVNTLVIGRVGNDDDRAEVISSRSDGPVVVSAMNCLMKASEASVSSMTGIHKLFHTRLEYLLERYQRRIIVPNARNQPVDDDASQHSASTLCRQLVHVLGYGTSLSPATPREGHQQEDDQTLERVFSLYVPSLICVGPTAQLRVTCVEARNLSVDGSDAAARLLLGHRLVLKAPRHVSSSSSVSTHEVDKQQQTTTEAGNQQVPSLINERFTLDDATSVVCPDIILMLEEIRQKYNFPMTSLPTITVEQHAAHDMEKRALDLLSGLPGDVVVTTTIKLAWNGVLNAEASCGKAKTIAETVGPLRLLIRAVMDLYRKAFPLRPREHFPRITVRHAHQRRLIDFLMFSWFNATPQCKTFNIPSLPMTIAGSTSLDAKGNRLWICRAMLFYDFWGQRLLFAETHHFHEPHAVNRLNELAVQLNAPKDERLKKIVEKRQRNAPTTLVPSPALQNSDIAVLAEAITFFTMEKPVVSVLPSALGTFTQSSGMRSAHDLVLTCKCGPGISPLTFSTPISVSLSSAATPATNSSSSSASCRGPLQALRECLLSAWRSFVVHNGPYVVNRQGPKIERMLRSVERRFFDEHPCFERDDFPAFNPMFYTATNILGELLQGVCAKYLCDYSVVKQGVFSCRLFLPYVVSCEVVSGPGASDESATSTSSPGLTLATGEGPDQNEAWKAAALAALRMNFPLQWNELHTFRDAHDVLFDPRKLSVLHSGASSGVKFLFGHNDGGDDIWRSDVCDQARFFCKICCDDDKTPSSSSSSILTEATGPTASNAYMTATTKLLQMIRHRVQVLEAEKPVSSVFAAKPPFHAWNDQTNFAKSVWHAKAAALSSTLKGDVINIEAHTDRRGFNFILNILDKESRRTSEWTLLSARLEGGPTTAACADREDDSVLISEIARHLNAAVIKHCSTATRDELGKVLELLRKRSVKELRSGRVRLERRIELLARVAYGCQAKVVVVGASNGASFVATLRLSLRSYDTTEQKKGGDATGTERPRRSSMEASEEGGARRFVQLIAASEAGVTSRSALLKLFDKVTSDFAQIFSPMA